MKKAEAEQKIRYYCSVWAKEKGYRMTSDEDPSFIEFWSWVRERDFACTQFRCVGGPDYHANRIFDREFNQSWKN